MFTIPNQASASFPAQAQVFQTDIDILVAGYAGTGVSGTGCAITTTGASNNGVSVAAGTVSVGGTEATVSSGTVTLTAPDGTNPRIDLVWADSSGTKGKTDGTAAAVPAPPALPASTVVLAYVYSPAAGGNTVGSTWITDKRVGISVPRTKSIVKIADESVTSSTVLQDDDELFLPLAASTNYAFEVFIYYVGGSSPDFKMAFTVPAGATIVWVEIDGLNSGPESLTNTPITGSGTAATIPDITTPSWIRASGSVINGSTAGNLTLQWAQGTSSATAATVKAGSNLRTFKG